MPEQTLLLTSGPLLVEKVGLTSAPAAGGAYGGGNLRTEDGDGSYIELWDHQPITLGEPDHIRIVFGIDQLLAPEDAANLFWRVRFVARRGPDSPDVDAECRWTPSDVGVTSPYVFGETYEPYFQFNSGGLDARDPDGWLWAETSGLGMPLDDLRAGTAAVAFSSSGRGSFDPPNFLRITYWAMECRWDDPEEPPPPAATDEAVTRLYPRDDGRGASSAPRRYAHRATNRFAG